MTASQETVLKKYQQLYKKELHDNVLPFWLNHSLDKKNGGYFNNLDRDGKVYDTTKQMWLQGRQVWMMSRLYNQFKDEKFLEAATLGADFIRKFGRDGDRVYFSLTQDGKPHFMQRKMFSECFYVMALAEYARATGNDEIKLEARDLLEKIFDYAKDPTLVGRPVFEGAPNLITLANPMILLNLIDEVCDDEEVTYKEKEEWAVQQIHKHVHDDKKRVFENVSPDGKFVDTPQGRLLNPGHAIEAGWFLLNYSKKTKNESLRDMSLKMIDYSLDHGWDKDFGGIIYFQDYGGYPPLQLEWSMKLWWPHCEALVALLMAYRETGQDSYLNRFAEMTDFTFKHFSDPEYGEWYGYLDRQLKPTHQLKGGHWKGCFHVPRALFLCELMLDELVQSSE